MADLVRHVLQVHRSWGRIVAEGITEPDWSEEPLPGDDDLLAAFRANAARFTDVLAAIDSEKPCWTWGPEQNAGFVQRFQVRSPPPSATTGFDAARDGTARRSSGGAARRRVRPPGPSRTGAASRWSRST